MFTETLSRIFERDLLQLKKEIESYSDENKLWIVREGISNPAGNLCLHLTGNLNHFIGSALGNTGYERDRDLEFSAKNIPSKDLTGNIDNTIRMVKHTLDKLTAEDLKKDFPLEKHGETVTTYFMLLHLVTHFNYHLGQINYHRRLL